MPPEYPHFVKTIAIECPDRLHEQLETLAREGWIRSPEPAVLEALRRFLDSHQPELQRAQILSDVQWGLHGRD
jgi:hypothetical protein